MVTTSLRTNQALDIAARTLCSGVAGCLALLLFLSSFRLIVQDASVRFWGGAFSSWATPVTMGIASGLFIGAALGLLFKQRSRAVAIGAGVLQVMLVMSGGLYLETFVLSLSISIGLFLGALVVSTLKRA